MSLAAGLKDLVSDLKQGNRAKKPSAMDMLLESPAACQELTSMFGTRNGPPKFSTECVTPGPEQMAQTSDDAVAFREYLAKRKEARTRTHAIARSQKKLKKSRPQRRAKKTVATEWLKALICPFVFGERTTCGIRPSLTKEGLIGRWNLRLGLPSLPNYRLLDHFQKQDTLYYFGNGWHFCKKTLVMIDIDVQKANALGSAEGAKQFANHLKRYWSNLYFEPSTNGEGIHAYFVLWKWNAGAKQVNAALKRLEAWLRSEAQKMNADVEEVEIKGTCLDLVSDGGKVQSVTYGSFAKLPRDASRFGEWEDTTVLRLQDLESSQYDVVAQPVVVEPEPKADVKLPVIVTTPKTEISKSVGGSVSGQVISDEELASIPQYERLYREWVGPHDLMAGKFRVTAHDFAVAMVLLRHFKTDPNSDGSLPTRRVAKLWKGLVNAGDCLGTRFKWNRGARFCVSLPAARNASLLCCGTEKMASGGP
ncbi:MAG TPA: hypothetical protein VKS79_08055, partial [Gemmataceae bacterium]|nr:hypothetical protein [Gemmataceae bacterium]